MKKKKINYLELMEIAGTLEHHKEVETKLFKEVCKCLGELESFCSKQHEENVYGPLAKEAHDLCEKLNKHFERYKNFKQ